MTSCKTREFYPPTSKMDGTITLSLSGLSRLKSDWNQILCSATDSSGLFMFNYSAGSGCNNTPYCFQISEKGKIGRDGLKQRTFTQDRRTQTNGGDGGNVYSSRRSRRLSCTTEGFITTQARYPQPSMTLNLAGRRHVNLNFGYAKLPPAKHKDHLPVSVLGRCCLEMWATAVCSEAQKQAPVLQSLQKATQDLWSMRRWPVACSRWRTDASQPGSAGRWPPGPDSPAYSPSGRPAAACRPGH